MSNYEQMELDVRLDADREMEENVGILIEFAHKKLEMDMSGVMVKNRHEGYSILSENLISLSGAMKAVSDSMKNLLRTLPLEDNDAINAVASIDNSLVSVVVSAVKMSAQAKRINDDLYENVQSYVSPVEEYLNSQEGEFEEAETVNEEENSDEE